jgi:hypothetical protein
MQRKVYKDINKVNENHGITKLVCDNAINTMNSNSNGIFKIKFKAFSTNLCLEYVAGKKEKTGIVKFNHYCIKENL